MTPFRRRQSPSRPAARPEDILASHTMQVRAMAERLRAIVRDTVPFATEMACPAWGGIGYREPGCGYFAGIFPQCDHVRVDFEHGAALDDPDGLLEGAGRQMRYVMVRSAADLRPRPLQRLLLSAVLQPMRTVPPAPQDTASSPTLA